MRQRWMAMAQAIAAVVAFVILAGSPPEDGFLLLLPLTAAARQAAPATALRGGATLVARGPWPGSLVVHGRRDRLTAPAGLLVLAAPAAICGGSPAA